MVSYLTDCATYRQVHTSTCLLSLSLSLMRNDPGTCLTASDDFLIITVSELGIGTGWWYSSWAPNAIVNSLKVLSSYSVLSFSPHCLNQSNIYADMYGARNVFARQLSTRKCKQTMRRAGVSWSSCKIRTTVPWSFPKPGLTPY